MKPNPKPKPIPAVFVTTPFVTVNTSVVSQGYLGSLNINSD